MTDAERKQPNTSQEIDNEIRQAMARHTRSDDEWCKECGEFWPCQYIIQGSITLKMTAIAAILQGEQALISTLSKGRVHGQEGFER